MLECFLVELRAAQFDTGIMLRRLWEVLKKSCQQFLWKFVNFAFLLLDDREHGAAYANKFELPKPEELHQQYIFVLFTFKSKQKA